MIEPPRQAVVGAVFEIHDGVFARVRQRVLIKKISGFVHDGNVFDLDLRVNFRAIKFGEKSRARNAVKTVSVVEYAKFHIKLIRFLNFKLPVNLLSRAVIKSKRLNSKLIILHYIFFEKKYLTKEILGVIC